MRDGAGERRRRFGARGVRVRGVDVVVVGEVYEGLFEIGGFEWDMDGWDDGVGVCDCGI